jgi:hypothetical protein
MVALKPAVPVNLIPVIKAIWVERDARVIPGARASSHLGFELDFPRINTGTGLTFTAWVWRHTLPAAFAP